MAEPFADSSDLQARWRTLTSEEVDRADVLLADASNMIRDRWPDVDARIAAGSLLADSLKRVVCNMVKVAMLSVDTEGLESIAVNTGPFGESRKFANPNGSLYFTAEMIRLLDGYGKKRRAFAVDLYSPPVGGDWLC